MAVTIMQTCDRCGASRNIESPSMDKTFGWRELDLGAGPARGLKPTLCPPCQEALALWISGGVSQ